MTYRFIQHPHPALPAAYDGAMSRMTDKLMAMKGVRTVTQVGGTGTPGISDIDFYVVFEDGFATDANPVSVLSGEDKYLFTHNLFGTADSLALQLEQYTFFGQYKTLAGPPFRPIPADTSPEAEPMKVQVALEYLLKAWMTIHVEREYGVVKIRNLFLVSKALLHDLALLRTDSGPLWNILQDLVDCRNHWFGRPASYVTLTRLVDEYAEALADFLNASFEKHPFYLPAPRTAIARNLFLKQGRKLAFTPSGFRWPSFIGAMHPKLFNLQSRFRQFEATVPFRLEGAPVAVDRRFRCIVEAVHYNRKNLPGFVPTAYGMNIFDKTAD